jgi:hypothetical protein
MSPLEQRRFAHMLTVAIAETERLLGPALGASPATAAADTQAGMSGRISDGGRARGP